MRMKEITAYNPAEIEPRWQEKWEDDGLYQADIDHNKEEILCHDDAALSLRRSAYRSLVCHVALGCARTFQAHAGLQCHVPDGL